jgi:hypothetical protein
VRITTENDCDHDGFCGSAQNTTARPMAEFFLRILTRELVDGNSSDEMMALLHEGQYGVYPMRERSFLTRREADFPLNFEVLGVKIGQGPLKDTSPRGNIEVRSEGIIIQWKNLADPAVKKKFDDLNLTGEGAVCWQNVRAVTGATDAVAEVINTAIDDFVKQAPLP